MELGRDELIARTLVRTFFMIVVHKRSNGSPEALFAEEHHSLQALGLGRVDKPFGKRVQIGTPRREDQGLDTTVAQQAPKGRRIKADRDRG